MVSYKKIAQQLKLEEWQVSTVSKLLEDGATIPFVARYRKEKTGNLDEVQIQQVRDAVETATELEKRRKYVIQQIEEQGKMTPELKLALMQATELHVLEDLYLPYKSRRKTRADVAREEGFEPLAVAIYAQKGDQWMQQLQELVPAASKMEAALEKARDIIAEWISEDTAVRGKLRHIFEKEALLECKVTRGKSSHADAQKYKDYFAHTELLKNCPSHRFLAMSRGVDEGWLKWYVSPEEDQVIYTLKKQVLRGYGESQVHILKAAHDAWDRLLQPSLESEFLSTLKDKADADAIGVFAENAKQLLLQPPLGQLCIMGIDPGLRTGCKVVVVDKGGELLDHFTIFPHEPQNQKEESLHKVAAALSKHNVEAIAVGNGTAGRETEELLRGKVQVPVYLVSEAGASIYSASEVAREEFPDKDLTIRGAVSIARRLMDPLAELVKIDPKHIGVGQYQHDVHQGLLKKRLDAVVESAVNAVGVNLNTASRWLLNHVSGLGPALAENIVAYRRQHGAFKSREELKKVARLGDKAYEQCAGFLRIAQGKHPLDNSAVHPERYALVERMAADMGVQVQALLNENMASKIALEKYIDEKAGIGLPTLQDILGELKKPGRDPRGEFKAVGYSDAVRAVSDLEPGMELNGIITNIVDFGAFVDIGVKQDGLVHVSNMSQKFIKHPTEVVKLGQHVKVRVMEVDGQRKRISLTMKF